MQSALSLRIISARRATSQERRLYAEAFSEHELQGKPRSAAQEAEILALQQMGDESIDLSDIPEIRSIPADVGEPGSAQGIEIAEVLT
jgi:hypothetical protein